MKVARTFFAIAVAMLVVAIVYNAFSSYSRARAHAACEHHLLHVAEALRIYTQLDANKRYPPLPSTPGELMLPFHVVARQNLPAPSRLQFALQHQYWYLGWIIPNERSGLEWIAQYRKYAPDFDAIPSTTGTWPEYEAAIAREIALYGPLYKGMPNYDKFESLKISPEEVRIFPLGARLRFYIPLREGMERFLITDIGNPTPADRKPLIPILFERPELHGDGGHVLYMDGHVEFVPYPGKFPMTPKFIEGLRSLDALSSKDAPHANG